MKDLYKDSIVKFKRTGNLYKILTDSGDYIDDPDQKIWIREFQDFNEKFELTLKLWN